MRKSVKDPVCGMVVSQITAPTTLEYKGKTYYFCADICRSKFEENPVKYIRKWARH